MSNFFNDILKDSESLFVDEDALDPEYIPLKIPFRENEQQYIADSIKPLLQKRAGKNLLITGSPGIGKTLAVKHVLREMEEKGIDEETYPFYINCWQKDSAHKIILDMCEQLKYRFTMNKTTEQLVSEISKIINKKSSVIVLDEADHLSIESSSILYSLLENISKKSIFLVTNNKEFLAKLDARIRSRLTPEMLEFRPYNLNETNEILKQRVQYAFVPGIFNEEAIKDIAEKTYQIADIRTGLFLLRESGNIAERKLQRKITQEHTKQAIERLAEVKSENQEEAIEEQNKLIELLKQNQGKSIKEIHRIYDPQLSYRTFLRKVKKLEEDKKE